MIRFYLVFVFIWWSMAMALAQNRESCKSHHEALKSSLRFSIGEQNVPSPKYFWYKKSLIVKATLEQPDSIESRLFTTFEGTNKTLITYGIINFELKNKRYALQLFQEAPGVGNTYAREYLLLPFTDETNGSTTFGGGRYIQIPLNQIENNQVIVDFNDAYTPWCAFANDFSCPVPPAENDLNIKIRAGEKFTE